jgi:hypothetical protein
MEVSSFKDLRPSSRRVCNAPRNLVQFEARVEIEMVLAALFGLLLAIDLVHLVIFFVRGMKARRQARRSRHAHAAGPAEGAALPPTLV